MRTEIIYKGKIYYGTNVKFQLMASNTSYALQYSDNETWCIVIDDLKESLGHFILEKNNIESHFLRNVRIKIGETNVYEYNCMSQYCLEINRAQSLIDPNYLSCTDGQMWCSIKWLKRNAGSYPLEVEATESIEPFNPAVCHRKLYKIAIQSQMFIFSPFAGADNKYTPIHEIVNYKFAQILQPPHNIYLPTTSVTIINEEPDHKLGIGSLKTFINIEHKNISTRNLPPKTSSWVQCYDYLIVNIERNWNDHLCVDDKKRYCLLDNDTGLIHLEKLNKNFRFSKVDHLEKKYRDILYQIHNKKGEAYDKFIKIRAPPYWYEVVEQQIKNMVDYLSLE